MKYSEWLDKNREELLELHRCGNRNDYEEALFKAFIAGMDYFCSSLQKTQTTPLTTFPHNSINKE